VWCAPATVDWINPGSIGREDLPEAQIDHVTETGSPRRQLVQIQKVGIKGVSSRGGRVNGIAAFVNTVGVLGDW